MILLEIQSIKELKPVKWESKDLSSLSGEQSYSRFAGDHPDNPESGSVVLTTKILEGSFDHISKVLFIGDEAQTGKLLNWKKKLLGGYIIEVQLNTIFGNGLAYSAMNFIHKGGAIVGLTQTERDSLNSISTQTELLTLLASYIIPSKSAEILRMAKPSFLCMPNDNSDEGVSHFLGRSKHSDLEIGKSEQKAIFHIATIKLDDFPLEKNMKSVKNILSFYLRTNDTENGWPEDQSDFKVINAKSINSPTSSQELGIAKNMDIRVLLDLPSYNHALIQVLNFTDDELDRFEALRSVYMTLLLEGQMVVEVNKLFGYPDSVQHCVSYEAERIFNNREYSDEIYKDAVEWTLLLQISPYCKRFSFFDDFGDGTIYYMIRKEDLARGNFDQCQIVVQST
jgi:uncharacterized protein YwqG